MNKPFSIDVKKSDATVDITVSGDLIINHIEKIKESLDESIDLNKNLNMQLDNPSGLDITFLQLIISLETTYTEIDKEFTFSGNFNDEINGLIANAGFQDLFKIE